MEASSGGGGGGGGGKRPAASSSVKSLGGDLLCSIFSLLDHVQLIRCSVVCKSWSSTIFTSSLMKDLYFRKYPRRISGEPDPSLGSMRRFLQGLAMEDHRSSFLSASADIHSWRAHNVRINLCRMRRGLILTGAEDKVLRLWSADSYKCLDEYAISNIKPLVDYDFDENKVVGLAGSRICILRRNKRSFSQSREGIFKGLCMRYTDPEAVVGCEDGSARVFDMYSGSCSQIIRMRVGPVQCLALTEEQLIFGGSTFGNIAVADLSSGELIASLKSKFSPTGMKSLSFNMHSHLLFAGSTSGYAHCWDLRTMRPLWETRISPNVIYSTHHLSADASTLAAGGLDGVLRLLSQSTGELLSSFVMDIGLPVSSDDRQEKTEKRTARRLSDGICIENIPRSARPPITCLAVGLKKVVTVHNDKHLSMWRFP
ncbi:F-box/WD-40 repeat-containing protein [Iris pallida]|uniref:F-box/WD-40 repeat-containing protein n=1 Tax=Iris pallida TaxID=29817 RepID=A0AAX6FE48_IRIPA|nr:F-box/WD-40 repeat-containing protein [Iris pallida]